MSEELAVVVVVGDDVGDASSWLFLADWWIEQEDAPERSRPNDLKVEGRATCLNIMMI